MENLCLSYEEYWGYYWRVTSRHQIPGIFDYDRNLTNLIEARCGLQPGAAILDLGCAGGDQVKLFARKGYQVTGVDKVPSLIDYANEAFTREGLSGDFRVGDFRSIQYEDLFDLVVMLSGTFGLCRDEDNDDVLRRIFRALKPGGQAFIDYLPLETFASLQRIRSWFPLENGVALREEWFDAATSTYRTRNMHILNDNRIIRDSDETGSGANEIIRCYGHREMDLLVQKHGFTITDRLCRKHLDDPGYIPASNEPCSMIILEKPETPVNHH